MIKIDTPENSNQAIDARIDRLMETLPIGSPARIMLSEVYRPYCKAMIKMSKYTDARSVIDSFIVLVANMIRELVLSTSTDPKRSAWGLLSAIKLVLKNDKRIMGKHLRK